jgi:integrase
MRLGKRPRIHDLRHSYASWLIHGGVPLPVIQQTLGHESITTTIGTYGHLDTRSMDVATTVISSALTQALPDVLPALPSGMPAPAVAD